MAALAKNTSAFSGIGRMLYEHGTQLGRFDAVELETTVSDPAVEVAERRWPDGSRFIFVRTEDHSSPHNALRRSRKRSAAAFSFDFQLEPFGSMVLYLPPSATDAKSGEWLPKRGSEPQRPTDLPTPVVITNVDSALVIAIPEIGHYLHRATFCEKTRSLRPTLHLLSCLRGPRGNPLRSAASAIKSSTAPRHMADLRWWMAIVFRKNTATRTQSTFDMPDGGKRSDNASLKTAACTSTQSPCWKKTGSMELKP